MNELAPLTADPERLLELILDTARELEFHTFVIGVQRPKDYRRDEHEALFRKIKIDLGLRLEELWPDRVIDFERPDVRFEIRPGGNHVRISPEICPIFIGGRYLKYSRQIPATRWRHQVCKGRGCKRCEYTGNVHGPSIQELATPSVIGATGGTDLFFHGAGREDVDARMLGTGRPFVFEIRKPRRRFLDLEQLSASINQDALGFASVHHLGVASRDSMILSKDIGAEKSYHAHIEFESEPPADLDELIASLAGQDVSQLSPTRVMRRRGEHTLRRKKIVDSRLVHREGREAVWEVRTSSGAYVKELVSGDDERTRPSIREVTGIPCSCVALDVVAIHWTAPWEADGSPSAD